MKYIDTLLKELEDTWGYTTEELHDIREKMLNLAMTVLIDSSVRKECEEEVQVDIDDANLRDYYMTNKEQF